MAKLSPPLKLFTMKGLIDDFMVNVGKGCGDRLIT